MLSTPVYPQNLGNTSGISPTFLSPHSSIVLFYKFVVKLSKQEGYCWARNSYFAKQIGVNVSTIRRWVATLREMSWVETREVSGVERHIIPLVPVPTKRQKPQVDDRPAAENARGFARGLRGVPPSVPLIKESRISNNTPEAVPAPQAEVSEQAAVVVVQVCKLGVSQIAAERLVADEGIEVVADQLEKLPHRTARDKAAVLFASVKGKWGLPAGLLKAHDEARKKEAQHAYAQLRQDEHERLNQQKESSQKSFDGLPDAIREEIESEAKAIILKNHPRALGRMGYSGLVKAECLRLYEDRFKSGSVASAADQTAQKG